MSERAERVRDRATEEKERIGFILLQHVYTLACEGQGLLIPTRIAADLALGVDEVVQLVTHLADEGFLEWEGMGRPVGIAPKGVDYIERLALRRRSLRLPCPDVTPMPEPAFSHARHDDHHG